VVHRAGLVTAVWTAAALAAAGCSGDPLGSDGTGTIRAAASTIGDLVDPDGYAVTLDGQTTKVIAPNGLATFEGVEPGPRTLTLQGVAPNCSLDGPNPRTVTVAEGAVIDAAFTVRCSGRTGALRVSASTSGSMPDPDGYAVSVDDGTSSPLGVNGTLTIDGVSAGAHSVRLTGVAANCVVGGGNPRAVTVRADAATDVTFPVTCTSQVGTLRVTASTTGSPIDPDGYGVALDGGSAQPITANGTLTLENVAAGPRSVELTGLAGNCSVAGNNPAVVTVTTGATTELAFDVSCAAANGSVRVHTQTSGSPVDPDGYTVSLDGGAAQPIGVAASLLLSDLGVGSHSLQLGGLAANCSTTQNPRTVAVTAGATVETTFGVVCAATSGTIRVNTSTSGSPADPDGYTVRLDGGMPQAIGLNASVTYADQSLGSHSVQLAGLANNCSVSGANPRTVSVTGGTTTVDMAVTCASALDNQILFLSERNGGGTDIYYMNPDGSNVRRLTTDPGIDQDIAISPDNTTILFSSNRTGAFRLYTMNTDASGLTNITPNAPGNDTDPEWSPDGSKIVFESSRNGFEEIYVTNPDGSGVVQLTDDQGENGDVDWSPDGSKIVFETHRDGPNGEGEIYVMDADGTNLINLTNTPTVRDADPAWSPDGTKIAYESNQGGSFDVWVMNADGSNKLRRTTASGNDGAPTWSPDGTKISFDSDRSTGANIDIWVMNVDGSNQVRLTTHGALDAWPEWTRQPPASLAASSAVSTMIARVSAAVGASAPAAAAGPCRNVETASGCRRSAELLDWRTRR
jgi:WD40 repeat protein